MKHTASSGDKVYGRVKPVPLPFALATPPAAAGFLTGFTFGLFQSSSLSDSLSFFFLAATFFEPFSGLYSSSEPSSSSSESDEPRFFFFAGPPRPVDPRLDALASSSSSESSPLSWSSDSESCGRKSIVIIKQF
jgi:hypothetical protein